MASSPQCCIGNLLKQYFNQFLMKYLLADVRLNNSFLQLIAQEIEALEIGLYEDYLEELQKKNFSSETVLIQ